MNADYLTDRSHILISGVSGSRTDYGGKTGLSNWWADNWGRRAFDIVLFLNFKHDTAPAETADVDVDGVEGVADAIAAGHSYICLTPSSADWEAVHQRVKEFIQALPSDMDKLVVHDEAPEYDGESLLSFVRVLGNGSYCKSLVIAQAPGDLDTSVRNQLIPCWVGPVTEQNRHYFAANHYLNHFRAMRDDHEPYHWSVLTGPGDDDRDHYEPVPEDYA